MSDDNIVSGNSAKAEKAEKSEKVKPEVSGQQSGVGRTEPYIQTPAYKANRKTCAFPFENTG